MGAEWTVAGLWLAVAGSGVYHGLNPGMGWPLAVSAGLMGRGRRDLVASLAPLALGHLVAMAAILLPFGALASLALWRREIQVAAGLVVIAAGVWLLFNRRHPRAVARIRPSELALWSFAVAMAHGAGLMLVPIYLGICSATGGGHAAAATLIGGTLSIAVLVAVVHAGAMIAAGGLVALAVHRWFGPGFISRSWFNLDALWATTLILVGAAGLAAGLVLHPD